MHFLQSEVASMERNAMETIQDKEQAYAAVCADLNHIKKNAEALEREKLELQEIKNGRLAMLAIGGMIHHNWVTGEALFPN